MLACLLWRMLQPQLSSTLPLPFLKPSPIPHTQVAAGYVLHIGEVSGSLSVGSTVTTSVDYERRSLIKPNHTFTHVLNYALR